MRAIILILPSTVFISFGCSMTFGMVGTMDIEEKTRFSDVVAIGKPMKLHEYSASSEYAYEVSTFKITRVFYTRKGLLAVDEPNREVESHICIVRQYKEPAVIWEVEKLELNKEYLLFLEKIPYCVMYTPYHGYPQFYEPTKDNLKKVLKGLTGSEDFAFRKEPMTQKTAEELAPKHLKIIRDQLQEFEDLDDREIWTYRKCPYRLRRKMEHYLFKPFLNNPDIIMITVEGPLELKDGDRSFTGQTRYFYSPIVIHEENSNPIAPKSYILVKSTECAVYCRGEIEIRDVPVGESILVDAIVKTRKGKRTICIWYKADKHKFGVIGNN